MRQHFEVNLDRPVVDGRPRYRSQCACGRKTDPGSRRDVQKEQKQHKIEERRKARL